MQPEQKKRQSLPAAAQHPLFAVVKIAVLLDAARFVAVAAAGVAADFVARASVQVSDLPAANAVAEQLETFPSDPPTPELHSSEKHVALSGLAPKLG